MSLKKYFVDMEIRLHRDSNILDITALTGLLALLSLLAVTAESSLGQFSISYTMITNTKSCQAYLAGEPSPENTRSEGIWQKRVQIFQTVRLKTSGAFLYALHILTSNYEE